jgi:PAS domain-containing protein
MRLFAPTSWAIVTFLNPVAEALTGWHAAEAIGRPFNHVFRIIDVLDHRRALDPMALVIKKNKTFEPAGREHPDSA